MYPLLVISIYCLVKHFNRTNCYLRTRFSYCLVHALESMFMIMLRGRTRGYGSGLPAQFPISNILLDQFREFSVQSQMIFFAIYRIFISIPSSQKNPYPPSFGQSPREFNPYCFTKMGEFNDALFIYFLNILNKHSFSPF